MNDKNESATLKWAWVLVAAFDGSVASLAIQHRIPKGDLSPGFFGEVIGVLVFLYALSMIFAVIIKGWKGVIAGWIVIAIMVALMNYR